MFQTLTDCLIEQALDDAHLYARTDNPPCYNRLMKLFEKKLFWLWVSFVTGAAGLGLEISASRLLAPHFGSSTVVWSSIIGVVLLALSAGYFIGGRLAERNLSETILLRIILVSGIFTLCIPLFAPGFLDILSKQMIAQHIGLFLIGGSVLASLLLFGLPVFLLGCVSPYLLALLTTKLGNVGSTSGQLLAVSTLGALLGTFLPTLILIPGIGTRYTIVSFGCILILTGTPGMATLKQKTALLGTLICAVFGSTFAAQPFPSPLAHAESKYQYIEVTERAPGVRYMQFDAGFGVQSVYNQNTLATGLYYDYASTLPSLLSPIQSAPKRVLIIGLAGGTIPRQLHALYGDAITMDAVEIDATSTNLAKQYMGIENLPLTIYNQDGRLFLSQTQNKYDFIYVDAYQNELQIPWALTTQEFWKEVHNHLNTSGIAAMNIAALGAQQSSLVSAITNTQATVFPWVYESALENRRNASHLVVMARSEIHFSMLVTAPYIPADFSAAAGYLSQAMQKRTFDKTHHILTDDKAPLEWLLVRDVAQK